MDTSQIEHAPRASMAWQRAGLSPNYVKLGNKHAPKYHAEIGTGAFGRAYVGRDMHTGKLVVIKKMTGEGAQAQAAREYRLGVTLAHPNLVKTLCYGVSPHVHREKAYLVTEMLAGLPLTDWGAQPRLAIGCVVAALCYLHQRRVAHTDIHTGNILQGTSGAWLIDLGCAYRVRYGARKPFRKDVTMLLVTIAEGLQTRAHRARAPTKNSGLQVHDTQAQLDADYADFCQSRPILRWRHGARPPIASELRRLPLLTAAPAAASGTCVATA